MGSSPPKSGKDELEEMATVNSGGSPVADATTAATTATETEPVANSSDVENTSGKDVSQRDTFESARTSPEAEVSTITVSASASGSVPEQGTVLKRKSSKNASTKKKEANNSKRNSSIGVGTTDSDILKDTNDSKMDSKDKEKSSSVEIKKEKKSSVGTSPPPQSISTQVKIQVFYKSINLCRSKVTLILLKWLDIRRCSCLLN